jgi:hypothetical protein
MYSWTWVLTGLCLAGVLLGVAYVLPVIRLTLRLRTRVENLQHARLFTSMQALELQRKRLEHTARSAAPLATRSQAAVQSIRTSAATAGFGEMREALRSAGAEISLLFTTLR